MGGKAILMVTIGFGFILSYISLNISGMSTRAIDNMSGYATGTESHNLAVSGANAGLAKFYNDTSWYGTMTQTFDAGDPFSGSFTVVNQRLPGGNVKMTSISTYVPDGYETLHDTVEVYFSDEAFNSFTLFAYMTLIEGDIWWITGDTVWGRMHSNDIIQVNGSPVFMDKVTTAKTFNPKPGKGTNQAKYKNGYETGVAKVDFPNNFNELIGASMLGGRRYANDVWVSLHKGTNGDEDGYALVRNSAAGPVVDSIGLNNPMFNGVILGNKDVHVKGTLDAQVSIASLDDIWVDDDVMYQNRNEATTNDLCGLIAEKDIIITNNVANNTNCNIDASIFCRTGSLTAQNYDTRPKSGNLALKGSLVQNKRGPVGTFSGSPPALNHGFYKRYRFDSRLADPDFRPPFYPGFFTKTYAITNWWENVRIPEFD